MSDREAMKLALDFVTSKRWGTRPYMEDGVFTDALVLAEALRTALAAPSLEVTVDPRLTPDEAAAISSALAAPRPEPSGYAYRYADNVLRFNDGGWLSGWPPVEAVPYWFAPPALAAEQPKPEPVRCNPAAMRTAASSPAVLFITELDSPEDEALRRDAERWRFYEAAGSNLTLRLHNTRSDHRNAVIDAAMKEDKR